MSEVGAFHTQLRSLMDLLSAQICALVEQHCALMRGQLSRGHEEVEGLRKKLQAAESECERLAQEKHTQQEQQQEEEEEAEPPQWSGPYTLAVKQEELEVPQVFKREDLSSYGEVGVDQTIPSPPPPTASTHGQPVDLDTWLDNFKVPWSGLPEGVRTAVDAGKRPSPRDRRAMVRIIVDEMRRFELNPTRADCLAVAKSVVRQFPRSFADVLQDGTRIGSGFTSLLTQLKTRVEHVNRNNAQARRRKQRGTRTSCPGARGPRDRYGCVRWQPACPAGDGEDSLQQQRMELKELVSEGGDRARVAELLHRTYCLQRRDINAVPAPSVTRLRADWPCLFTLDGMCTHFQLLTNVPILQKMEEAFVQKSAMILQLFRQTPTNADVQQVLSRFDAVASPVLGPCVILLLMAHFREDPDALLLHIEDFSSSAEVEQHNFLPDTPRLVLQGGMMSPASWMLSVEGQVVLCSCENFSAAMAALFASFYNLNLLYPEDASCTLEFIQRCFVGMNPAGGSKTPSSRFISRSGKVVVKKQVCINPHVCSLLRRLMDCDWLSV